MYQFSKMAITLVVWLASVIRSKHLNGSKRIEYIKILLSDITSTIVPNLNNTQIPLCDYSVIVITNVCSVSFSRWQKTNFIFGSIKAFKRSKKLSSHSIWMFLLLLHSMVVKHACLPAGVLFINSLLSFFRRSHTHLLAPLHYYKTKVTWGEMKGKFPLTSFLEQLLKTLSVSLLWTTAIGSANDFTSLMSFILKIKLCICHN